MNIIFLVGAIIFLFLAHIARIQRWKLFINIYEEPKTKNLIQALSVGHFINLFIPFRVVGDIFRAIYSGKKMKNKYSFSFSTVIVDRILDVIVVGIIFLIFFLFNDSHEAVKKNLIFYMFLSFLIFLTVIVVYGLKKYVKIFSLKLASLFNQSIELNLLKFMWSLIWNFKDIFLKINKVKMVTTTISMWILYIFSYYSFSLFLIEKGYNFTLIGVFTLMFSNDVFGLISQSMKPILYYSYIFLGVPIFLLLIYSKFIRSKSDSFTKYSNEKYLNLLPNLNSKERLQFLEKYFMDKDKTYINNYLKINQNINIIRDFSAGSNATTMLCMKGDKIFYRKYAFEDREKLYDQIRWIEKIQKKGLPLPKIIEQEKTKEYCYYDMEYDSNAVVLFEYVHSMPYEKGWNITKKALEALNEFVYIENVRKADKETIEKYIDSKVTINLKKILEANTIKKLSGYDEIIINGRAYKNLKYYLGYLSKEYLYEIFKNDIYSELHGDLTIENIVCTRDEDGEDSFYIIDPNTGNIHDSPNLDYGKLLQSIHGGYEFMMKTYEINVEENKINFLFTKSHTYVYFFEKLNEYMNLKFDKETVRSIYFHEIIHWLRLLPYKIKIDKERVLMFYSGLLMILHDVIEMYGDENEKN
ncbi:lysylphosphatidylglycerol synthase transmembrane domain-containing protein [Leptotrichia sp. oral taxon 212]|uniref:lysylphosphatidylglycerol synthase transmembrane domain-containing protein n=1 Tax=Leptotrichia sp. oral taxon 212 TaxID=712357 RepID=UPI0006A94DA2|nr:lysylphosphatidylglycerol synthase transmembrane domain-containing protein [Leptotrichia sp. oral taxon 212]ALA96478.1 hypothetical protein AMK43_11100 [Leptotrichia sp. oral taxon 212]